MAWRCDLTGKKASGRPQSEPLQHQDQAAVHAEPAQRDADLRRARPLGAGAHLGQCAQDGRSSRRARCLPAQGQGRRAGPEDASNSSGRSPRSEGRTCEHRSPAALPSKRRPSPSEVGVPRMLGRRHSPPARTAAAACAGIGEKLSSDTSVRIDLAARRCDARRCLPCCRSDSRDRPRSAPRRRPARPA